MPDIPEKTSNNAREIAASLAKESDFLINSARNLAQTLINGTHMHKRAGSGDEFFQFRPYSNGESISMIDWRQSAKSDNAYVKQKEQQSPRNFGIFTLHNQRFAWSFSNKNPTKSQIADICALAIGYALIDIGENIIVAGQDKSTKSKNKFTENLVSSNLQLPKFYKKGTSVLFHDGFCDIEELHQTMQIAAKSNCRIIWIFVEDIDEKNFSFDGRVEFCSFANDVNNSDEKILIENCAEIREKFIAKYNSHFKDIEKLAKEYFASVFYINNNNNLLEQIIPIWQHLLESDNYE